MGTRVRCLVLLVSAALLLGGWPRLAHADDPRSVGYVLSFRLGVGAEEAQSLIEELAKATGDWHGQASRSGEPVARNCASSKACLHPLAASLGVSRIGVVAIVAAAGVVRLDVRLMDGTTGNEIQRTHSEFEIAAGPDAARRAIFDLIPRLLPGEKASPVAPVIDDGEGAKPSPKVPDVAQISVEPAPSALVELPGARARSDSGTRWWLWGGLGAAAATITIVALVVVSSDDPMGVPTLELPPPP